MLEQCVAHTPTLEEAYGVKARILKHAGDPEGAAAAADRARHMDLADRCGPPARLGLHPKTLKRWNGLRCNSTWRKGGREG